MATKKKNEKVLKTLFIVAIIIVVLYVISQRQKNIHGGGNNPNNTQGQQVIDLNSGASSGSGSSGSSSSWTAALMAPLALLNPFGFLGASAGSAAANYFNSSGSSSGSSSSTPPPSGSSSSSSSSGTNYPVRKLTSPMMKGSDITEMQKSYNRIVGFRKQKNVGPAWPTIAADGIYGPNTRDAMVRFMGQDGVKLNQVLTKEHFAKIALGV